MTTAKEFISMLYYTTFSFLLQILDRLLVKCIFAWKLLLFSLTFCTRDGKHVKMPNEWMQPQLVSDYLEVITDSNITYSIILFSCENALYLISVRNGWNDDMKNAPMNKTPSTQHSSVIIIILISISSNNGRRQTDGQTDTKHPFSNWKQFGKVYQQSIYQLLNCVFVIFNINEIGKSHWFTKALKLHTIIIGAGREQR